jgi:DNA (cytosine-5)-methyltransferase 1
MKYFSMFSGIGGFEIGIQRAFDGKSSGGFGQTQSIFEPGVPDISGEPDKRQHPACVGYSEIDKYAIKVYERQFNGHTNYGDATTINAKELPDFDLLVGGFPCQAFSVAGKRAGFNDTRGTLFFDIARILKEKRPRHLVLENVKGLLSHEQGKTFQTIIGVLSDIGYRVEWQVLNSKNFGVPQNRERVFIIGHLRGECSRQVLPIGQSTKVDTKQRVIGSTLTSRYPASQREGTYIEKEGNSEGTRVRKLTPKECERLQGFPDDWTKYGIGEEPISDTQRYKMCGNAVTTSVVQAVIENLKCL